jgi:hypothetical protein
MNGLTHGVKDIEQMRPLREYIGFMARVIGTCCDNWSDGVAHSKDQIAKRDR